MPDLELTCADCGMRFIWSEKEQRDYEEEAIAAGTILDVEPHCRGCRVKQDGQRS